MKKAVKIAWLVSFAVELVAVVLYFYYLLNQTVTTLDGIDPIVNDLVWPTRKHDHLVL